VILTFFSRCINWHGVVNLPGGPRIVLFSDAPRPDFTITGFAMTDPVFQQAYSTVRRSCSDEEWAALTPRQITDAIYREIRRIDTGMAVDAAQTVAPGKAGSDRN
jgi:hypothetical protein